MKNKKKLLIKSIVYAAVAFFMMTASVFAWFFQNKGTGNIILDTQEKRKCEASLYEFIYTDADKNLGDKITFDYVISAGAETDGDKGKFFKAPTTGDVIPGGYILVPGLDRYFRLDLVLTEGTQTEAMIYLANISLRLSENIDKYKDFIVFNVWDDSDEENPVVKSKLLFGNGVIVPEGGDLVNLATMKANYKLEQNIHYSIYFSIGLDTEAEIDELYDEFYVFSVKYIYIRY